MNFQTENYISTTNKKFNEIMLPEKRLPQNVVSRTFANIMYNIDVKLSNFLAIYKSTNKGVKSFH